MSDRNCRNRFASSFYWGTWQDPTDKFIAWFKVICWSTYRIIIGESNLVKCLHLFFADIKLKIWQLYAFWKILKADIRLFLAINLLDGYVPLSAIKIFYTQPVTEFKEFERRFKFKPRFKYGWFHLKLYQMFQDLSRRLI